MFERFTDAARQVVVGAQAEAARLHRGRIGTEHLLLALLGRNTPTTAVLGRHGLTRQAVTESVVGHVGSGDLDAEALTALGIDLDAVRSTVEASFGPGALDIEGPRRRARARAVTSRSAPGRRRCSSCRCGRRSRSGRRCSPTSVWTPRRSGVTCGTR